VAHWSNIFASAVMSRGLIAASDRSPHTASIELHSHVPDFIDPENCPSNSIDLNPVDFQRGQLFAPDFVSS